MWRSFFFAVGFILILFGLQSLVVQEFRVDKNNRLFAFARKANRVLDGPNRNSLEPQNGVGLVNGVGQNGAGLNGAGSNLASQQQFSLPSSTSYYGGPSRFQTSSYQSYGGSPQYSQQQPQLPVSQVSNATNFGQSGSQNNLASLRPKLLMSYPVTDWMPWGFLAAGTIISLYTNSTGRSGHSGE